MTEDGGEAERAAGSLCYQPLNHSCKQQRASGYGGDDDFFAIIVEYRSDHKIGHDWRTQIFKTQQCRRQPKAVDRGLRWKSMHLEEAARAGIETHGLQNVRLQAIS